MSVEEITGRLVAITWRAEDGGGAVIARVRQDDGRQVAIKGTEAEPPLAIDVTYRLTGQWETHEKYGRQFAFAAYAARQPEDRRGVVAYLQSLCQGIGEKRAAALWDRYGPLAVSTLRTNPEAVAEAGLLSAEIATEAAEVLRREARYEQTKVALLSLLSGRGFQLGPLINAALGRWGAKAPALIKANPYNLLLYHMPSAGFSRCDKLYLDLGHPPGRLKRQLLVAVHHLREARGGDTWHTVESVGAAIEGAVGEADADPVRAIRLGVRSQALALRREGDERWVALGAAARNEADVAETVEGLLGWTRFPKRCGVRLMRLGGAATSPDTDTTVPASPMPTWMTDASLGLNIGDAAP